MRYSEFKRLDEADARFNDADLKRRYEHFNALLFEAKLPDIPVEYAKLKTVGGVAHAKVRAVTPRRLPNRLGDRHAGKELVPGSVRIQISSLYQRDPQAIDGILVHEMIHIFFYHIGDFSEDHGRKFRTMRDQLNAVVDFEIPLTDDVTGLALANPTTRKVGVIVLTKKGDQKSVAVVSEAYIREHLDAIKTRWTHFIKFKYVESVLIMVCTGRIEARYPIQRKKVADLRFFIVKEPALLDEAMEHAEILASL